jgi:hypothetical protein
MTHTPNTRRHDVYAPIHKAYRSFMGDTLARLGRIDLDDAADAAATLAQVRALLQSMRHHIAHENRHVHPMVANTGAMPASALQHEEHLLEIADLEAQAAAIAAAPRAERDALAHRLYLALSQAVGDQFLHMLDEERANNLVLWAHYTDGEIEAMHDRLVADVKPEVLNEIMGWMLPALTPAELAAVLGDMRAKAPPPAFAAVLELARDRLAPARFAHLQRSLCDESEPALG